MKQFNLKFEIIFILILFFGIFGLAESSRAACSGLSPKWTCSPDYTSINNLINNQIPAGFTRGDTIEISAGSAVWDNPLTITKGIILKGAGKDVTIIKGGGISVISGGEALIIYAPDNTAIENDETFDVSGLALDGEDNAGGINLFINHSPPNADLPRHIRIHHNKFIHVYNPAHTMRAISFTYSMAYGLVDSNEFVDCTKIMDVTGNDQYSWWYETLVPGSDRYIYFENNTISFTSNKYEGLFTSSGNGGKYVLRYNTYNVANRSNNVFQNFDMHGNQADHNPGWVPGDSNTPRGTMGCEIYNNLVVGGGPQPVHAWQFLDHRGGMALVFNNKWDSSLYEVGITQREEDGRGLFFIPALTAKPSYDPIRDSYYWNNKYSLNGTDHEVLRSYDYPDTDPTFIVENVDYLLTTPIGKTIAGVVYEPYQCPHPLTGYKGSCDSSVAGTAGYNIGISDTIAPAAPSGLSVN